jgi:predicted Zn-dependent protease
MAHATSRHGSQRVLEQNLAQTALTGVAMSLSDMDYDKQRAIMGALGAGAQYGVLMPFGRKQESEADRIGIELTAKAGYNPQAAPTLWQKMRQASGNKGGSDFLSTHPADEKRQQALAALVPQMMPYYEDRSARPEYAFKTASNE